MCSSDLDFDHAVTFLKDLRLSQPSDPNVLASLGWAVWKSSGEANRTQAEEFLRLAASFAPQHVQAREYMARIALDAGDHEPARQRLEHLLAVKPDASWARAALNRLPPPDDGGGRRCCARALECIGNDEHSRVQQLHDLAVGESQLGRRRSRRDPSLNTLPREESEADEVILAIGHQDSVR